jgi:hypothetical protein
MRNPAGRCCRSRKSLANQVRSLPGQHRHVGPPFGIPEVDVAVSAAGGQELSAPR